LIHFYKRAGWYRDDQHLVLGLRMTFSRGESIALWTGIILFLGIISCLFYRLCSVTCRTMIYNVRPPNSKKKKLNPTEKKVNKILSNENAREILKAHAITAINSQANKTKRGFSSQFSLDSIGTVPDLTDRVIRVSFAPTGGQDEAPSRGAETAVANQVPEPASTSDIQAQDSSNVSDSLDQDSISGVSIGCVSNPPPYDTLSTHSRVSASDPPPEYASVASPASPTSRAVNEGPASSASVVSVVCPANVASHASPASVASVANVGEEAEHE